MSNVVSVSEEAEGWQFARATCEKKKEGTMGYCLKRILVLLTGGLMFVALCGGLVLTKEKPYQGVPLRIALVAGFTECPPLLDALIEASKELGTEIKAAQYSFDELHDKLLVDYVGGNPAWDIVFVHVGSRAKWVESGLITPIGKWTDEHPDLVNADLLAIDDFYDISIKNYTYKGTWLGPSLYVTGVTLFYRTDLFNHPTEQKNFKARYGYELGPPETYKQFRDVAEFFTRKKGEVLAGKILESDFYGTAHSNKPVGFLWHDFVNYLMAFGADNIYDPQTLRPTFSSPEAIAAGKYFISLAPFLPPGHMSMTSGQSTSMFAQGYVAMIVEYFLRCTEMVLNPEQSKVSDKVDFTLLPSVEGVQGRKHAAHFGGNCVALYSLSPNKEAAYKTIELAFSRRIQKKVLLEKYAPFGWVPPRPSVLGDPEVQRAVPWLRAAVSKLLAPEDIYYFELPALPEYFHAMDIAGGALSKALAGEADVETAFNEAQLELENLFKKAGYIK